MLKHLKGEIKAKDSLLQHMFSVWPCPSLSEWVQMNLWRCNPEPGNYRNTPGEKVYPITHQALLVSKLEVRSTWKCSCPGTVLWGNSGRNMVMNPGRLHSALSLSGPTPANLRTCSGISGGLPWSIRRCPRRRAGGARRQRPAGMDRPMLERKLRHPDEKCSSSCPSAGLCWGEGWTKRPLWHRLGVPRRKLLMALWSYYHEWLWSRSVSMLSQKTLWKINDLKGPDQSFCMF